MINKKICLLLICSMSLGQIYASLDEMNEQLADLLGEKKKIDLTSKSDKISASSNSKTANATSTVTAKKRKIWDSGSSKKSKVDEVINSNQEIVKNLYAGKRIAINLPGQGVVAVYIQADNAETGKLREDIRKYVNDASDHLSVLDKSAETDLKFFQNELKSFSVKNNTEAFKKHIESYVEAMINDRAIVNISVAKTKSDIKTVVGALDSWHSATGIFLQSDEDAILKAVDVINSKLSNIASSYEEVKSIVNKMDNLVKLYQGQYQADAAKVAEFLAQAKATKAEAAAKAAKMQAEKDKTAAAQAEATKKAAQEKAAQDELANKKELAAKASLQEALDQADLQIKDIAGAIEKIAKLSSMEQENTTKLGTLIEKIKDNSSAYNPNFVRGLDSIVLKIKDNTDRYNELIDAANKIAEELKILEKEKEEYNNEDPITKGLSFILGSKRIKDINGRLAAAYKSINATLENAEKLCNQLVGIYTRLVVSEGNAQIVIEVNPDAIARSLELFRAVKQEEVLKIANALELFRAVSMNT